MTAPEDLRAEVANFSKQLVSRLAPHEVEFFEEIETQFYLDPKPHKVASVKDDPLQFGLHDAAHLITPAAIAATTAVFVYLRSIITDVAKNVATTVLKDRVSSILAGGSSALLVKPSQLDQVRRMARSEALKYGVTNQIADTMAEDIVRSLHS